MKESHGSSEVLPVAGQVGVAPVPRRRLVLLSVCVLVVVLWQLRTSSILWHHAPSPSHYAPGSFHITTSAVHLNDPHLCPSGKSYAGHIGLKGDTDASPRRSFYWFFEAQNSPETAPVIMTLGGGPGTSGMFNPLVGQSHCKITANGSRLEPHENAWSENFNLLAIDHPIGTGFSYGGRVNNSRDAAYDVYDFLQKFYVAFPQYSRNKFIVASGSYGGTYVPHIATVIREQNELVASGRALAKHVPLDALMISNPYSDTLSYYRWMLHQNCYNTDLYNTTTCGELYGHLPYCLEKMQFALENPSIPNKADALNTCRILQNGDTHGKQTENVKLKCDGSVEDCHPQFAWIGTFMNNEATKAALGVSKDLQFIPLNDDIYLDFVRAGDLVQSPYLLYGPLLEDGIRVLHYLGMLDCNCGWPGTVSFLKLLRSRFREAFISAPDLPWPTSDVATVRAIGEGAGNMTLVLMAEAGHMVTRDQPGLVKQIVDHWAANKAWFH